MDTCEAEILLIENNPYDAELTVDALNKCVRDNNSENKILVVEDGVEALDYIFAAGDYADRDINNRPKLILLDLKLLKINGIEILRKIKSDERTKMIPVVVLTSSFQDRDIAECYKLGANSYIVKPVNFDHFSKAITDLGLYWLVLNQGFK